MNKILLWAAVVLWIAVLFYLSSQPAIDSNALSKRITEFIVGAVEKVSPNTELTIVINNTIIRENAHFFAYLVLGILVIIILNQLGIRGFRGMGAALFICIFFAVTDEIHQIFVLVRGGQVKDLLTDSIGATVGINMYLIVNSRKGLKKENANRHM